jgi:steroid delta-isomerase-like uncharacterized protein
MAQSHDLLDRLFRDGINGGEESAFDDVLAEDYVNHTFGASGKDAMKGVVAQFRSAFPDLSIEIDERVVDGDRIAQRGHFSGTHQGEFNGIPPSGRQVTVQWMDFWTVRDGKLADNWVVMDFSPLMAS